MVGRWPFPGVSPRSSPVTGQGPFPPPALPGLVGPTSPSAICRGRPRPSRARRCPVGAAPGHRGRLPLLRLGSPRTCCHHYPGGTAGCASRSLPPAASAFPVCVAGRLPRRRFEACSVFTRVAARAVRCPPEEVFSPDASGHSSPPDPSGVLPAGARAAGWGSNPPNRGTFGQGTHTNSIERAIRPIALGARTPSSRARMVALAIGRSWRAWWRPRSSMGSSPWRGSPTYSSGWSRAGSRRTSSSACCPGPGRRSGSLLPSMVERRDVRRCLRSAS